MNRIAQLEKEIRRHNDLYWKKQTLEISDIDYDNLVRELASLDPDNPLLTEIHSPISVKGLKVKHVQPMLSLDKVYSVKELIAWCEKVARNEEEQFLIQYKFDGCSAEYFQGTLSTRGDGLLGENITDKIPLIYFIDNDTQYQRGEIVLSKSTFEQYKDKLKKKDGTPYSNSRNACAGLLNRDDNENIPKAIMAFVPFDYVSEQHSLKKIRALDIDYITEKAKANNFPTDGLVVKLADEEYKKSLGATSHHARGELALKFANDSAETILKGVTWSSGKEVITPIGNVETVEIGGVNISNVSLHNMQFIKDKDIHIGDTLVVERAGDVIPHVVEVIPGDSRVEVTIKKCPECGSDVYYDEPNIKCSNYDCSGNNLNKLYDAVRRIGIERLGKPTLKEMMTVLDVQDLTDIILLNKDDLLKLDRFGDKKADNLLKEISVVYDGVYEWQILSALNIPGIGTTLSKMLCEKIPLSSLIHLCSFEKRNRVVNTLCALEQIEFERANELINGINDNLFYLERLMNMLPIKHDGKEESFNLQRVCFTGKFPEKKSYYYEKLKGKYEIVEKVDKNTDILVVADPSVGSNKQKKAEKMGIKIMGIDEIMGVL